MATTDHKAPGSALRARIDERFFAPFKRNTFATRTWFLLSVAGVLGLHAAVLGYFLYRDTKQPVDVAQQETPVEVVVEPPPPSPPPPAPQQRQQKQEQEIEKPASSAPRTESDTKLDTQKLDSDTHAPKTETPPQDGQPQPALDAGDPNKEIAAQDDKAASAPPADVLKKDEEALAKATPAPKPDPAKALKAKIAAKLRQAKAEQRRLAGLSDLPDYKFARQTKRSPVSGGTEDSRYLAIVYGLIMQNLRPAGEGSVTVSFELDTNGEVMGIDMMHTSGDPMTDAEVINAVRRTSPFPPPPPDRPHSLTATILMANAGRPPSAGDP